MANNFRWFNEPGRNLLSPSNEGDPNVVGYQPSQEGALSILGRTLQGIAAPFAGDYHFNQRQAQQELMQQKADQEFQALLMKNAAAKQAEKSNMKSVYTTGPDGGLVRVGEVPIGSQVISNPNTPTADMRNQLISAQQARTLWDEVKSQSEELKGGYEGMLEMGKAALNRGKGESGKYPLYTENLPSSAVALYRALTGDTRLSDSDAKARALPLLWEPSQDTSLRTKKNAFIDKMINAREELLSSGKYKDGVIPLSDLKKAASSSGSLDPRYEAAVKAGYSKEEIDAYLKGRK